MVFAGHPKTPHTICCTSTNHKLFYLIHNVAHAHAYVRKQMLTWFKFAWQPQHMTKLIETNKYTVIKIMIGTQAMLVFPGKTIQRVSTPNLHSLLTFSVCFCATGLPTHSIILCTLKWWKMLKKSIHSLLIWLFDESPTFERWFTARFIFISKHFHFSVTITSENLVTKPKAQSHTNLQLTFTWQAKQIQNETSYQIKEEVLSMLHDEHFSLCKIWMEVSYSQLIPDYGLSSPIPGRGKVG
jgi:hypothetical protein